MKKIILLLLAIVSINTQAQTWSFKSYKNAFDGDIKAAYVEGSSDGLNLFKPMLAINKFVKKSQVNFYLDNIRGIDKNDKLEILWAFNNNGNEIYTTTDYSIQEDAIFFRFFSSKNRTYTFYEIIKKLKESSTVSIRVKNKEDSTDYTFSLKGSSNTISKVISSQKINEEIKKSQSRIKEWEKYKSEIDSLKKSLRKLSTSKTISIIENSRKDLVGKTFKFLKDDGVYYQNFGESPEIFPNLFGLNYIGRDAKVLNVSSVKSDVNYEIYEIQMTDTDDTIYYKVPEIVGISNRIGFYFLLQLAKSKYLNKTFFTKDLDECIIKKISFNEDFKYKDGGIPDLPFKVIYEVNEMEKTIYVHFSEAYAPKAGFEFDEDKSKVFENIFYFLPNKA